MALEVWREGAWVTYTADTTRLPVSEEMNFRDTSVTIDSGTASIGPFHLPWAPQDVHFGMTETVSGTVTAGTMTLRWQPKGSSLGADVLPAHESALSGAATPRSTADTNEFATVVHPPTDFYIRLTGMTGTATAFKFALLAQKSIA